MHLQQLPLGIQKRADRTARSRVQRRLFEGVHAKNRVEGFGRFGTTGMGRNMQVEKLNHAPHSWATPLYRSKCLRCSMTIS